MKVRTDFHSVNLSTGEKTRSVVGDGQIVDETMASTKPVREQGALWVHPEWLKTGDRIRVTVERVPLRERRAPSSGEGEPMFKSKERKREAAAQAAVQKSPLS